MDFEDQVILFVGERRFLLKVDEAMLISKILNGASRITTHWRSGMDSSKCNVVADPAMDSVSFAPVSAPLQLELETNTKAMLEEKRR